MKRRTYVTGIGSALTAALAGCAALGSDDDGDDGTDGNASHGDGGENGGDDGTLENGSFESGLDGWTVGKDLPPKPGEETGTVDHDVTTTTDAPVDAADGEAMLQFTLSGAADDGTLWVEQGVDFGDVETVALDVYSRQASFNEIGQIAFFAGRKPGEGLAEEHFDREHPTENHEGWKTFRYDVSELSGAGVVAVGLNIVWETEIVRLYDDVRLVSGEA
jgi:hypothetical protein